jgi:GT2 family glycosyltransferase
MSKVKPKLSIVILAWNNKKDLKNCVDSIIETYLEYFQLIIVDNASRDKTLEYLEELNRNWDKNKARLDIIKNNSNLGYAAGNNIALDLIEGEYTLWLNQDIIVQDNSIIKLIQYLDQNSKNI